VTKLPYKALALASNANGSPLHSTYGLTVSNTNREYQALLTAFGLGPFSVDEGIGALMHSRMLTTRPEATKILQDLVNKRELEIVE